MNRFEAVRLPPTTRGKLERVAEPAKAVIVGGGLAGVAAATVLAERGVAVTLLERESFLGGRAGAWTEQLRSGNPFEMERGFHAFFRQYYNVRALLRRIDPDLSSLIPLIDYPLIGPGGAQESFSGLPTRPPLNVIELVRRTPRLDLRALTRVNALAALEMMTYDPARTFERHDHRTAREYLDSLNFPPDARLMLFNVFAHSFFNPEEGMSAGELLAMFHFYFMGNPEGLIFDVMNEPFSLSLWEPLRRYIEGRGVEIHLGCAAERVTRRSRGGWRVEASGLDQPVEGDVLLLAVEVPGLKAIAAESPDLSNGALGSAVDDLDVTLPFAVWRLWLDRAPDRRRQPFAGTAGIGIIDNISIYERFEGESRRWALKTGGSIIELHAYATPADMSEEAIKADLLRGFYEAYPEMRRAEITEERFLLRRDCPAFAPGAYAKRPTVTTPLANLALAGDYVRLPFPSALMERAVASGFIAANHLMERWDARPEPIWSVPQKGMLAGLPLLDRLTAWGRS